MQVEGHVGCVCLFFFLELGGGGGGSNCIFCFFISFYFPGSVRGIRLIGMVFYLWVYVLAKVYF